MDGKRKAQRRLFLRLVLIVTICFIWGNSFLGREDSASLSLGFTAWLRSLGLPVSEHFVRKAAHFCEFCLLGCEAAALFWLRSGLSFQNFCNGAFICLLTATADETIQIFSGRGPQVQDVVLDFCGGLTGIALTSLVLYLMARRKKKELQ